MSIFRRNSLFILCGPSNCGKSTFADKLRSHILSTHPTAKVRVLSSDATRREILDEDLNKMDPRMSVVSRAAFELLEQKLKILMQFPQAVDYIILDSTALNRDFRVHLVELARSLEFAANLVIFDYRKFEDYLAHVTTDEQRQLTHRHLKKFRETVLPRLDSRLFKEVIRVKSYNFDEQIQSFNYEAPITPIVGNTIHFIGDLHGCKYTLSDLLIKAGFEVIDDQVITKPGHQLVLLGDLVDKCEKSKPLIDFLHKNQAAFKIIVGNHDRYVANVLGGTTHKTFTRDPELEAKYFNSLTELEQDAELRTKFLELHNQMLPYLVGNRFVATHSPVSYRYLLKAGTYSEKQMRNTRLEWTLEDENVVGSEEKMVEWVNQFEAESDWSHPKHIFGHISVPRVKILKNRVFLDTGAIYGNQLSLFSLYPDGGYKICSVDYNPKDGPKANGSLVEFKNSAKDEVATIPEDELEPYERRKLHTMVRNKVNFISGTVAPAKSTSTDLECPLTALEYFKSKGVELVHVQPKYMGSRCNLYLQFIGGSLDTDNSYAISRNGAKIELPDDFWPRFPSMMPQSFWSMTKQLEFCLLDGELLPWSYIGNLVERDFRSFYDVCKNELEFLKDAGFIEAYTKETANLQTAREEMNVLPKKEFIDKFSQAVYANCEGLRGSRPKSIEQELQSLEKFNNQVNIFANDGAPVTFKAFDLLKVKKVNQEDEILALDTSTIWELVSLDRASLIDLSNIDVAKMQLLNIWLELNSDPSQEGVVVKPQRLPDDSTVARFIKIRNKEYLRIIYGYNYDEPSTLKRLIQNKNVGRKITTSVNEWKLGRKLLAIPRKDCEAENQRYKNLLLAFFKELREEKSLDPRL